MANVAITKVSLKLLHSNDVMEWLRFTFNANPAVFRRTFALRGIKIDGLMKEFNDLVTIHNTKKMDVLEIVKNIQISKNDLKANIVFKEAEMERTGR